MDQQSELLRAVIESADSDSPRLTYADWCASQPEEALRAHGEFIRLQMEIGRTAPATLNSGGKYVQQLRMGELADKWSGLWAHPLWPYVDGYVFHRGFAALVKMSARNFIEYASDVFALAPIRHLDLTGVREVAGELFRSDHLLKLYSLSMNACGLDSSHIRLMTAEPKLLSLRWLSLEDNQLDYEAARILAGAKSLDALRVVNLAGNPVNPTEELGIEGGEVVDTNLPESGERLEQEFGPVRWLHWTPDNSRFS
jgi:uncharacterized protein (TIGR02996 family)